MTDRGSREPTDALPEGLVARDDGTTGCWWPGNHAGYRRYHDEEWGRPVGDDDKLFEKLCLEGFQAGLSWLTILNKRERFREVFAGFVIDEVARFGEADVERLLGDAGIIRHRGKIEAAITNAALAQRLRDEVGSLAAFFWSFEPAPGERPSELTHDELVSLSQTPASHALSKELRRQGFRFVGPTTMYALMQAMGIVDDHLEGCSVRPDVEAERAAFVRPNPLR